MPYFFKLFLIILFITSCESKSNSNGGQSNKTNLTDVNNEITRLSSREVDLHHNFPDTLDSGDIILAYVESQNENWKIVQAFVNCQIGNDSVFRIFKRSELECLELPVIENKVHIEFTTMGKGNKLFDLLTIIFENDKRVKKATEIQLTYYLK